MTQLTKQSLVELIESLPASEIQTVRSFVEFLIDKAEERHLDNEDIQKANRILSQSTPQDWIPWDNAEAKCDELQD
jgi:hypothetical protein